MIPLQLTLKNFLSYREANLDFRGLHTACICGSNGAGKSSLLEAITWVIWGQSRTVTEDDVIHAGEKNVRVDFQFMIDYQTYRVIRTRQRGRSSVLEFQLQNESGSFISLTGKGLRGTQQQILSSLKLDYDTFINSAYLRQGRADEFMLRRPSERKQILADLLKLDQYEELATQAKDFSKQFKGQAEQLELSLQSLEAQLERREILTQEKATLEAQLKLRQQAQETDWEKLEALQAIEHQRQTWHQQLTFIRTQYQNLLQDCDRLEKDRLSFQGQIVELQGLINQESEISAGYRQFIRLQEEEEAFSAKFQSYQDAQQQRQQLAQQLNQQVNDLNLQIRHTQTRLEDLEQQEQEIEEVVKGASEVATALETLKHHRQRLKQLDQLQHHVAPLLQRRQHLYSEIDRVHARLTARLEQMRSSVTEFYSQMGAVPQLRQTVLSVDAEIKQLENKRVYRERVHDKGLERRDFQQRLQENQRTYEKELGELQQKLEMLQTPGVACPLCERELDEHHRNRVIEKTQKQKEDIQQQFWMIREQMAVCDRELQVLRVEYQQLSQELAPYESLLQQRGQLEAQLENTFDVHERLREIEAEKEKLERSLTVGNYALELQTELETLERDLQRLNYDEQTHALARGEVEKWRWAEIKQVKIEDATRRQASLQAQKPKLLQRIASLQGAIEDLRYNSAIQKQIERLEQYITELGYDRTQHNNLTASARQAQSWQLRYQKLEQAQQQYPQIQIRIQELEQRLHISLNEKVTMKQQLDTLVAQMEQIGDNSGEIRLLEQQIHQRRRQLDELLAQQGRLEQSFTQLQSLQTQYEETCQQLKDVRRQYRVYQELGQAFGKNGIQALMIENILPQLEAETNQILARLTGNQFHVQFLTQRAGKSSRSKKKTAKLIDTLDILIADVRGTRPYETYSGGEAFRINFSIRLALARLLAQRAGTSLQMLIVDEGFGTQDAEGCDRLIAAINAIAADFACILTVTHMPQFKEAFQTRIEVHKTNQGSQLRLSS
ncbi:MAG: exonuclease subunit SbcC [Moorea sp. SIO2B7]|nr:exonuclease subunit SbcC [Moorena sp. SIO2B7]